jgi:DNA-binding response OmpR family regulator
LVGHSHRPDHRRVVLVEDDEVLQRRLAGAITRYLPDVDVEGAPDAPSALRLLDGGSGRLLLTEVRTRTVDGLTLVTEVRRHYPDLPVIVLGATRAGDVWRDRMAGLNATALVEKPPQLDRLVALVGKMMEPQEGFAGEVVLEELPDLVQMLALSHSSGALSIQHGDLRGQIWFEKGNIVHAEAAGRVGIDAFQLMLEWQRGAFVMDRNVRTGERSIAMPAQQLLLECARRFDEEFTPPPRMFLDAEVFRTRRDEWTTPEQRAAQAFERGLELVKERKHVDALREWEQATSLDPANRIYQVNLRRLRILFGRGDER